MNTYEQRQVSGNVWPVETSPNCLYQPQRQAGIPEPKKQTAIFDDLERQMSVFVADLEATISDIRRLYVLRDEDSVLAFLAGHRSSTQLLLEAEAPLRECFGSATVVALKAPIDDSGSQTLYAVVLWPGNARDVRAALSAFDNAWWLAHASQASGRLSFTYELV